MRTARRWGLFNLIGTGGFIVQMTAIATLTRVFGWHYGWATALAIELAILHNFVAHTRWTWADRRPERGRAMARTFGKYQLVKTVSLAANVAITAWLVARAGMPVEAASAIAVGGLSIANFLAADALVFRKVHSAPSDEALTLTSHPAASGSDLATAEGEVERCDNSLRPLRSS